MAGTLTLTTLSDGTNSTSATNCIQGSAKAWVNFNGTGVVAIRASYNVSSITDNGTGDYTINFTTAMPDANYSVNGIASGIGNNAAGAALNALIIGEYWSAGVNTGKTTSGCRIVSCDNNADTLWDCYSISVVINR